MQAMSRATVAALALALTMCACTAGSNETRTPGSATTRPGGPILIGSLDATGWSLRAPAGWHAQDLPSCANAPARTGVIVSNVAYRFTNPDGRAPGCGDRLVHPHFPSDAIAIGLQPVGVLGGAFMPQQPTPFPLAWSQLEVASPGIDGPRALYLGLIVHASPFMSLRAWVGDSVSDTVRRQAADVLRSIAVQGEARWKRYRDPDGRFALTIPSDWLASNAAVAGDRQYGAVATFPIRPLTGVCQAPFPVSLVGMREDDVAIAIGPAVEGERADGARPARFGPSIGQATHWNTCQVEGGTLTTRSFTFTDAGAPRHVALAFGARAQYDGGLKREVWTVLDSLRFGR
jgi:hypothetical protein